MTDYSLVSIKVDKKMKELFSKLAREEGVDISQAIRELMAEALARGYIIKERREAMKKALEASTT